MAEAKMTQVIRDLRKKLPDGNYGPQTYLGAYLRFVDSMRGANNRNLEEQLLLGSDCLMMEAETDEAYIIQRDYYDADNNSSPSNCYRLVSFVYKEDSRVTGFDVNAAGALTLPDRVVSGIQGNILSISKDANEISLDMNGNIVINPGWVTTKEDILYYIGDNEDDIVRIASKVTQEMSIITPDGMTQKVTKAVVTLA